MNVASIKDRLKNISNKTGRSFQDLLIAYGLERIIYRISVSKYNERFVLKGGIFLYALNDGNYPRVTVDIDLLALDISNDEEKMKKVFEDIFSIKCDDALRYDFDSLKVKSITEFKEYQGVNVSINAYLDRTLIPITIDIGFNDVIYPGKIEMDFPVLLTNESPKIFAYSIYTTLAEKFEAFASLGLANSRYKDFYDIYTLAKTHNLDGDSLKNAIIETFNHRNTTFNDIVAFKEEFVNNPVNMQRWNSFIKKKKVMSIIDLKVAIELIKELFLPIVDAILNNKQFNFKWSKEQNTWK